MIIQLKGKVNFPITLDPTVWIFDDRKVMLEEAFLEKKDNDEKDTAKKTAELFNQEIYSQKKIKPPVNKSLNRYEREKALTHSFVMPIRDFIETAEIHEDAKHARLKTNDEDIIITTEQLKSSYFLFAVEGKTIKADGPVHVYFGDGSNQDNPFKGIQEIIIE